MSETPDRKPWRVPWALVVVVGVVVIAAAPHAPLLVRYRRELAIEKHFEAVGGGCGWDASPPWPLSLLGGTYAKLYVRVDSVNLTGPKITNAGLVHLKGLAGLKWLDLGKTQITDAGLVHLKGLAGLKDLHLDNTQITGAGLAHLKGLAGLQVLSLANTQITDAGLVHLKGLVRLEGLWLDNTQITDAGVAGLKVALPKLKVHR